MTRWCCKNLLSSDVLAWPTTPVVPLGGANGGRLNAIQKTMLQWNRRHPYNAIHVARLRGTLDATRLRNSIRETLSKRGVTRMTLDDERFTYAYDAGPADCEIVVLNAAESPLPVLVGEMERHLNLRFDHARPFSPFRFLVAATGDSFYLGLVYFHPVADAESIVYLLKDIAAAYQGTPNPDGRVPDLYPDNRAHLLTSHPKVLIRKLLSLPAQIRSLRHSHQPSSRGADNMTNGFSFFALAPEDFRVLVKAAKSWEVTINDLLLANLMKSLSPCASARTKSRKRPNISVGCIVNLRKDLGLDNGQTFGTFLGSFTITHAVPEGISLRGLASDIQRQTASIKLHRLYVGTPLDLFVARLILRFSSPTARERFYSKYHPLMGGITNMNLNNLWERESGHAPLDYFRGVSTGPVTPMAMSATTVGDRLNLGLSYRTAIFTKSDIEGLQHRFREQIEETRRNS